MPVMVTLQREGCKQLWERPGRQPHSPGLVRREAARLCGLRQSRHFQILWRRNDSEPRGSSFPVWLPRAPPRSCRQRWAPSTPPGSRRPTNQSPLSCINKLHNPQVTPTDEGGKTSRGPRFASSTSEQVERGTGTWAEQHQSGPRQGRRTRQAAAQRREPMLGLGLLPQAPGRAGAKTNGVSPQHGGSLSRPELGPHRLCCCLPHRQAMQGSWGGAALQSQALHCAGRGRQSLTAAF